MNLSILTIQEVGAKIKRKDFEATKKWLRNKNITIHKDGKQLFVYEIDVDTEIDKLKVIDLQKKYPDNWQEVYKKIAKEQSVYDMVLHSLGGVVFTRPTTRVHPINKKESEFLNKYKT